MSWTIDNNYVTGIGNAIILRHHPCNALSASRAHVEKWSGSVHWQSFTYSPRSRATGSNYTVIQKFIVDLAIDLLGIFVSIIYAEVHEHSYTQSALLHEGCHTRKRFTILSTFQCMLCYYQHLIMTILH